MCKLLMRNRRPFGIVRVLASAVVSTLNSFASRANPWPTLTPCLCCCLMKRFVVIDSILVSGFIDLCSSKVGIEWNNPLCYNCLITYAYLTLPVMQSGYYLRYGL